MKPAQVRMARAALNWSLADLAKAAGVHRNTISNFETEKYGGEPEKVAAIRAALEAAGVEFTNGGQPGVRMNKLFGFLGELRSAILLAEKGELAEGRELACKAYVTIRQKILDFASQDDRIREREQIKLLQLGADLENAIIPQSDPARELLAFLLEKIRVDSASGGGSRA